MRSFDSTPVIIDTRQFIMNDVMVYLLKRLKRSKKGWKTVEKTSATRKWVMTEKNCSVSGGQDAFQREVRLVIGRTRWEIGCRMLNIWRRRVNCRMVLWPRFGDRRTIGDLMLASVSIPISMLLALTWTPEQWGMLSRVGSICQTMSEQIRNGWKCSLSSSL